MYANILLFCFKNILQSMMNVHFDNTLVMSDTLFKNHFFVNMIRLNRKIISARSVMTSLQNH